MKKITLRQLLREPLNILPVPIEGIHVVREDRDDFIMLPYLTKKARKDIREYLDNGGEYEDLSTGIRRQLEEDGKMGGDK